MEDEDLIPTHEYETLAVFPSQFSGTCTLNMTHKIRRGDFVSKIQRADNPYIPVPGVACSMCTRDFPKAKK